MTLTIDRGKWLTGEALKLLHGDSVLLDALGLQCCLGMYLESCGVSKEALLHVTMPSDLRFLDTPIPDEAGWLLDSPRVNSPQARVLQELNDDVDLAATDRELFIRRRFHLAGVKVEFTGDYQEAVEKVNAWQRRSA